DRIDDQIDDEPVGVGEEQADAEHADDIPARYHRMCRRRCRTGGGCLLCTIHVRRASTHEKRKRNRFVTDPLAASAPRSFAFGPFMLIPERQLLLRGEVRIRIGGRALDILTLLVEHAGDVVSKRELLSHAWPDVIVEESNLKVNMAALRRLLGEAPGGRYIATVVGR